MCDLEKVKTRIRKLLALGKSQNIHEAALAMSKARELAMEYQISMAELWDTPEKAMDEINWQQEVIQEAFFGKAVWILRMSKVVEAFQEGCVFLVWEDQDGIPGKNRWLVVGEEAGVASGVAMMEYLLETAKRLSVAYVRAGVEVLREQYNQILSPSDKKRVELSFLEGFVDGVWDQVQKLKTKPSGAKAVTAMIVLDKALQTYVATKFSPESVSAGDDEGGIPTLHAQGYKEGLNTSLNRQMKWTKENFMRLLRDG